ncbi:MAG: polysaccharide biosynthesis protein [Lachnospiraceae bacterium]|nr:polysaccharide biosynthesis protein [Lachnospiraceae bacterium]
MAKKKDNFVMQAGILAVAGIIVRIIGLLYNKPMVAIIGDEGNGYYDSAYAAYSIVLLISSYSIPSAVSKVIAQKLELKEYRNAHRIFRCAFIYVLVVGSIASLFVFFGAGLLVEMESAILPLRVLAPTVFLSGILGVFRGYFQAHKTMAQTSISQILEQLANAGVSIGMAYVMVQAVTDKDLSTQASYGAAGGTLGTGAGVLAGLLFMLWMYGLNRKIIMKRVARDPHQEVDSYGEIFKTILLVVTPFILSTGIYNVNNFLDKTIYQKIMMLVMDLKESVVATDLSAIAKGTKISNIPIALASAMATALIPSIASDAEQGNKKSIRKKVAKSMKVTMLISIPATVGIAVLAKPIMRVIFNQPDTLDLSSKLLAVTSFSIIFYGISTLTQAVLQSIGKMITPIVHAAVALVLHAAAMAAMLLYMDNEYRMYYYVVATVLYSVIVSILNGLSLKRYLKYKQEVDKTFLRPAFASMIMGAVAFGAYHGIYYLLPMNLVALCIAVVIAVFVYFVLVIALHAVTEDELLSMPKGHLIVKAGKKLRLLK